MNYVRDVEPVTVLKSRSAELIRRARETGEAVLITQNGKPTAVLVDVETYQRQRDAFLLLKLLTQGDLDDREGRSIPHREAKKRFAAKLKTLRDRG